MRLPQRERTQGRRRSLVMKVNQAFDHIGRIAYRAHATPPAEEIYRAHRAHSTPPADALCAPPFEGAPPSNQMCGWGHGTAFGMKISHATGMKVGKRGVRNSTRGSFQGSAVRCSTPVRLAAEISETNSNLQTFTANSVQIDSVPWHRRASAGSSGSDCERSGWQNTTTAYEHLVDEEGWQQDNQRVLANGLRSAPMDSSESAGNTNYLQSNTSCTIRQGDFRDVRARIGKAITRIDNDMRSSHSRSHISTAGSTSQHTRGLSRTGQHTGAHKPKARSKAKEKIQDTKKTLERAEAIRNQNILRPWSKESVSRPGSPLFATLLPDITTAMLETRDASVVGPGRNRYVLT